MKKVLLGRYYHDSKLQGENSSSIDQLSNAVDQMGNFDLEGSFEGGTATKEKDEINFGGYLVFKYGYNKKGDFRDGKNFAKKWFEIESEGNHVLYDSPMCSLSYTKNFLSERLADDLKIFFETGKSIFWEIEGDRRRVSYWGDVDYAYGHHIKFVKHRSGSALNGNIWHPILLVLLRYVNNETNYRYNSLLVNEYKNGKQGLNHHKDDESTLDKNTPVLTISLGAVRNLNFVGTRGEMKGLNYHLNMAHNSAVFMLDNTNKHFKHGILHSDTAHSRYSITFRKNLLGNLPYKVTPADFCETRGASKRKVAVYFSDGKTNLDKLRN